MNGIPGRTLVLCGHGALVMTSVYIINLIKQVTVLNLDNIGLFVYLTFFATGFLGVSRYLYPSALFQRLYKDVSCLSHGVGLLSLAILCLTVHGYIQLPPTKLPLHLICVMTFLSAGYLFGPGFQDNFTRLVWTLSSLVICIVGMHSQHYIELVGSAFLFLASASFYINRVFTENRIIFGINDIVWYLLFLNLALVSVGYSFYSNKFHTL